MLVNRWSRTRIHLLAMLTSAAVAACSTAEPPANEGGTDEPVTLTVLVTGPAAEYSMSPLSDGPAKYLMFLPMVDLAPDGSLEGRLARRWELSENRSEWIVHLNPEVRWHDGVPVTSADIAFTVELMSSPNVGYMPYFGIEIEVLDDSTLIWRSTQQSPLDPDPVYYPRHILGELDPEVFYEWDYWAAPVGNGPYRYVKHVEKTFTELEANPDYFAGPRAVDRLVLKYGAAEGGAITELLAGNVHAIPIEPLDTPTLAGDERYRITYDSHPANQYQRMAILWNHRHPIFSDARVRRAATHALDRVGLLPLLDLPPELPVSDVIISPRQAGEQPPPIPYDPGQARLLLDDAGWRDTDGDGIREKEGVELAFTAITDGLSDRIAVIVQDRLADVGIRMEIASRPGPAVVWGQHLKPGDFEAAVYWWTPGRDLTFGRESFLGYRNEHVIECLEAINSTSDPAAVDSLYREMWTDFQADVPVTFLHPAVWMWASDRRLKGLSSPYRGEVVHHVGELWWEEAR
jgi:peptide/nickel transport system substrate-binding protein